MFQNQFKIDIILCLISMIVFNGSGGSQSEVLGILFECLVGVHGQKICLFGLLGAGWLVRTRFGIAEDTFWTILGGILWCSGHDFANFWRLPQNVFTSVFGIQFGHSMGRTDKTRFSCVTASKCVLSSTLHLD